LHPDVASSPDPALYINPTLATALYARPTPLEPRIVAGLPQLSPTVTDAPFVYVAPTLASVLYKRPDPYQPRIVTRPVLGASDLADVMPTVLYQSPWLTANRAGGYQRTLLAGQFFTGRIPLGPDVTGTAPLVGTAQFGDGRVARRYSDGPVARRYGDGRAVGRYDDEPATRRYDDGRATRRFDDDEITRSP